MSVGKSKAVERPVFAKQHAPAGVGVLGRTHAGKHPESPVAAAVARDLVAAQVGKLAGGADITGKVHTLYVFGCVEPFNFQVGNGGEALFLIGIALERFLYAIVPFAGEPGRRAYCFI
jgi:hypothetical protein